MKYHELGQARILKRPMATELLAPRKAALTADDDDGQWQRIDHVTQRFLSQLAER